MAFSATLRNLARQQQQQQQRRRCRVVVCGVGGRMGAIRTELVYANPRFELCGVLDANPGSAEEVADRYSTEAFGSLEEVTSRFGSIINNSKNNNKNTNLDGLVVAVPTPSHGGFIRCAADQRWGVFVEKPVAESPSEIESLYGICEERGVPLCCGFQRRFDPSYAAAAEMLKRGRRRRRQRNGDNDNDNDNLGRVSNAHIVFGDSPGPSLEFLLEGGDIFYDLSVHDVDFVRWALGDGGDDGDDITSVYARGASSTPVLEAANIQDSATMMMTTRKGTVVTLSMNRRASYGYDQRCEIFCENGKISIGNEPETTTVLSDADGEHNARLKHSFDTRFKTAFSREIDAFADVLIGGPNTDTDTTAIQWPIKKEDVIRVQQVAEAAKKSLESNQVVHL